MKGQYSIRFSVDGHCVTLVSDSIAVSLKIARVLQEQLGCGSAESASAEMRLGAQTQLFSACSRPLLVGPDLRLVVSGVPREQSGLEAASSEVHPVTSQGQTRIYSRADFNYRLKGYLVQVFAAHPDILEALGKRWGVEEPTDTSSDGVRRLLYRVLNIMVALSPGDLLEILGGLPDCAGLRKPLLDYFTGTHSSHSTRGSSSGAQKSAEPTKRPKPLSEGAGQESKAI